MVIFESYNQENADMTGSHSITEPYHYDKVLYLNDKIFRCENYLN